LTERYIRCPQCGLPHDPGAVVCESCGSKLIVSRKSASIPPPAKKIPSTPVPPAAPTVGGLAGMIVDSKYRLLRTLGEGAMGTVYEAEHIALGRHVAIKVLHAMHQRSADAQARFHLEARAASSIGHLNICEVYDIGSLTDGRPFMVMELLRGKTLAARIRGDGGLPFDEAARVMAQVLSALAAAHEKGIIHRDIKPENVFLAERVGTDTLVKLLDFGIVKVQDDTEQLSLTRTGAVMGTPFYMAPEQAMGESIDARVDLYACGVLLYEMLTGRRPFNAANYHALVQQIIHVEPRDPAELRPDIPPSFLPVLRKAMCKTRAERYPDAITFQRDISVLQQIIQLGAEEDPGSDTIVDPGTRMD
jgi:eukaryotic-like serine/threonine-protein kinase